ncbi:MAG: PilZ domain-containing protein [Myxococcota bacterium]
MDDDLTTPPERSIRRRCDVNARLEVDGRSHRVRVLDLSETGAFIETSGDFDFGAVAKLHLPLPGGEEWTAEVELVRPGASQREVCHGRVEIITVLRRGVGVSFLHVPAAEHGRLTSFLTLLDER